MAALSTIVLIVLSLWGAHVPRLIAYSMVALSTIVLIVLSLWSARNSALALASIVLPSSSLPITMKRTPPSVNRLFVYTHLLVYFTVHRH